MERELLSLFAAGSESDEPTELANRFMAIIQINKQMTRAICVRS